MRAPNAEIPPPLSPSLIVSNRFSLELMMTSDRETFHKEATAFRNLRDLAQKRRGGQHGRTTHCGR
jgi:hypothetical protein